VEQTKFWGYEGFCPNSPNLPGKFLCDFCLQIFSHRDHEDLFWYYFQKYALMCFSAHVGYRF